MIVIMYPENAPHDEIQTVHDYAKEHIDKDVLCIPQDYKVIADCTILELMQLKNKIDGYLADKIMEMNAGENRTYENKTD